MKDYVSIKREEGANELALSNFFKVTAEESEYQEGGRTECGVHFMFITALHLANEE